MANLSRSIRLVSLLLIGASAIAQDVPAPERIQAALAGEFSLSAMPPLDPPQNELARRWLELTRRETLAIRNDLKPWARDPNAKLLTTGLHVEHGVRPNTQILVGLAVVARYGQTPAERDAALADLIAILRFVAPTHSAGPATCSDGKKWRDQWQSALWAAQAGMGAWLVWDKLDPELRWLTANLICHEADRFLKLDPPHQIKNDTKAEENAWDSMPVSLAAMMFPKHPHAGQWETAAIRWQLSSFVTEADTRSDRVIDGRPIKSWNFGPNLHPDYTLENHDRVHPSYMGTISLNLVQCLAYRWAGKKPPEAISFNALPIDRHLKFFTHPDGRMHFPNGQDWELHRVTPLEHALMALLFDDRQSAFLERVSMDTLQLMQKRNADGRTLQPQEFFFPSLPGMYVSSYATCFLLHQALGNGPEPASEDDFHAANDGVRLFDAGQFIAQRTRKGWVSFAWGNRIMGLAIPFGKDLLGSPCETGFVGTLTLAGVPAPKKPIVLEKVKVTPAADNFTAAATLARNDGAIEQSIAMVSLGDGIAVYVERLTARKALKLAGMETGTVGVLNEPEWVYQSGPRRVQWPGTTREIDGRKPAATFEVPGGWASIDNTWGFVSPDNLGFTYEPNSKPARGRREQFLHLRPAALREYQAGEVIAQRSLVVCLNSTAEQTAALAKSIQQQSEPQTGKVSLELSKWRIVADLKQSPPEVKASATDAAK